MKKENAQKEAQRKKAHKEADAALQAQNKLLQAESERLREALKRGGGADDVLATLTTEVEKNDKLEKENKRCQNRIHQLEKDGIGSQYRERDFQRRLKELGVGKEDIKKIVDLAKDAERKYAEAREKKSASGGK
jgi:hypothetical protein